MVGGDWNEVFEEAEAEYFVGREKELERLRQNINLPKPRYLFFYITGQGGAGKTTLLHRYQEITKEYDFLLAECDEQQRDVPAVLGHFAQQLDEQSHPLKRFNERYKVYRQKMHEIESDPEAPQGLAATLARTVVRAVFIGGDVLPGMRKGLEFVPREAVETQASEWATYLSKKFSSKDDMALVREPITILTTLFFEDLNEIAQKQKVLFCFDNFEATRLEMQEWLVRLREYKPSLNIQIAIASRDRPGAQWDRLQKVTLTLHIDIFTEEEADTFLDIYNITNPKRRKEILGLSGRLPVLMSWLAAAGQEQQTDASLPTHDVVERFLRWITDPALKQVALLAAIPRVFNVDILEMLLQGQEQTIEEQTAFDWLQTMPFVQQRVDGWLYHDVVRRMMLHYQRQKSPQKYRQIHKVLANLYNRFRHKLDSTQPVEEQWISEEWQKNTLAYVYHFLAANPHQHWEEVLNLFVIAIRKRRTFSFEIIELLHAEDIRDELTHKQIEMVELFRQSLQAIREGGLEEGFSMFDRLSNIKGLSSQAKGYALAYRGECYRLMDNWEKALVDFGEALYHLPEDAWTIGSRGETYQEMKRYEEALADFDRALALDEKDDLALTLRGVIYLQMERFEDALADFDRALALDEKNAWVFAHRGEMYRKMGRYEEALVDYDRAVTLGEDHYTTMGLLLSYLGRYSEAIENYEIVLRKEPSSFSSLYNIAVAIFRWRGLPVAQTHLDKARQVLLPLLDTDMRGSALYGLGGLEALTENFEQALDYFEQAISLTNSAYDWAQHDIAWSDMRSLNERFRNLILAKS